jgi:RNA polymerase sigma factor (sigma-70 family)
MTRPTCRPPAEQRSNDRWSALWRHHDELVRLAIRRVPCESDAEDVVHEALALAAADPRVELVRAGAWLNRVVRNRCADLARERSYADKRVVYERGLARVQPLTEEVVCDRAEAAFLARMLRTLPTRQHEALIHASEGLSNAQIADRMSTTVKAIESLLVKARRTLRTAAAALVAGWAVLCRRTPRPMHATVAVAALGIGLSVAAIQGPSHLPRQPSPLGDAAIGAEVVDVHTAAVVAGRAHRPTHGIAAHRPRAAGPSAATGAHPRRHDVDVHVGPRHTHVSVDQYGPTTDLVPAAMACLRGGVVVSPSYTGCRTSPGRD